MPTLKDVAAHEDFELLRELLKRVINRPVNEFMSDSELAENRRDKYKAQAAAEGLEDKFLDFLICLLYTSPSPRD